MSTSSTVPDNILRFLNALPTSDDPFAWIPVFRDELCLLLGDVDRVTVNVNLGCDLQHPENYRPRMTLTKHNQETETESVLLVAPRKPGEIYADQLLEDFRRQGYPLAQYHPPHGFDYFFGGSAYLGTIFLWREIAHNPISDGTLQLVKRLEPFIVFALSDLVARRQHSEPDVRAFTDALQGLTAKSGLSGQELRVVTLQLFGHSYKEMADILGISMDGVKHHLKMIHRKTGARSYTELFAKYFTPRLDMKIFDDETPESEVVSEHDENVETDTSSEIENPSFDITYSGERSLGERARKFGEVAFGSIEEFAKALKIAPSNLQKYLNGERNPGLGTLQRLYELGCNVNSLIGGEGSIFAGNRAGRQLRSKVGGAVVTGTDD